MIHVRQKSQVQTYKYREIRDEQFSIFHFGVKLAFCIDNRYLSSEDSQFVDLVTADLEDFQAQFLDNIVLLFPPVNNYLRLLIHKTVEDFPDLHSFSIGEGEQRQTVVCWTQALINRDQDTNFASDYLRPQGMRGRGRARFKDRNSPSPNPGHRHGSGDDVNRWSHDRYSSEPGTNRQASPYDDREALQGTEQQRSRLPCQQTSDRSSPVSRQVKNEAQRTSSPAGGDSDASGRVRKSERSKNRRPDVQVYVPRARRQQPGQNGTENQASPDRPDVTPRATPVRQKKKEMERYVPRGRLEQQNKERDSAFQKVNQPTIDMQNTNIVIVESTKNVHKKIKVTDHASAERYRTGTNSYPNPEQEVYQNEVGNDENEFCDNEEVLQRDDSRTIVNESPQYDLLDDSKNIPKHTSKCEYAPIDKCKQLDVSNDEDISDNTKNLPELSTRTENELNKVTHTCPGELTGFHSDSADLTLSFTHPTAATTNISSNSSAKIKSQEVSVEQAADGVKVESQHLCEDLKDMVEMPESTADTIRDNHCKKSNLDNTADVEMCSETSDWRDDLNENNSHGDKVTSLQSKEDLTKCSNDSAVIHEGADQEQLVSGHLETYDEVTSEVDNVKLKSALFMTSSENVTDSLNDDRILDANVETNVNDTSEKLCGDKANSEIVTEVAVDSNKTNTSNKCDQINLEDEILTEQNELTDNTVEKQSDINSADAMDITHFCDDSYEDQKSSEYKDQDLSEKLVEQSASSHTDSSKLETLEQENVREEAQSGNVTIDSDHSEDTEFKMPNQSEDVTIESSQSKEEEVDEDSWDAMFDDDGECLDPTAMEELTKTVGKVKIQKSKKINYLDYQPKDKSNFDFSQYEHIIEIYDFPAEFVTRDLIIAFQAFMSRGFDLKWVDDTHALGIFSSAIAAKDALQLMHPLLKVCPLSQASKQSQNKAKRCTEFLQPYKPRPETSAMAARRLVAGALGIATGVSREKRELERKQLKEAKAKKRQERQNRENIWEYGKCAMDEEP